MVDNVISAIEGGVAGVAGRTAAMTYASPDTLDKLAGGGAGEPRGAEATSLNKLIGIVKHDPHCGS